MSNLLPNPETGSANPSASLPALWAYIQPALDHIIRSPTNGLSKAPAVDVNYHMGIHTALYNYFTTHVTSAPPHPSSTPKSASPPTSPRGSSAALPPGHDIYDRLDAYFAEVAREVLLGAPIDDCALVHYLVPCYIRYSAGAQSINRLLNYVNRQYVRRAVDEDKGWLRFGDIVSSELAERPGAREDGTGGTGSHKRIAEKMRERRSAELRRWGAPDGATAEQLALAEACAEAASAPEHVVPVLSLAYRRFRTEVLEPLLAVPNPKKKKKNKGKQGADGPTTAAVIGSGAEADEAATGPKGRLARSVKELLESKGGDEEEQNRLAGEMAEMLMRAGIRPDHPLRRRLRKCCVTVT
jgi:hypothetical protein